MSAMKRDLHELSESELNELQDRLMIPAGEFVAVFAGAVLTVGLVFGPPTLASAARHVVLATAGAISGTFAQLGTIGSRVEAKPVEKPSEKPSEHHPVVAAPPR